MRGSRNMTKLVCTPTTCHLQCLRSEPNKCTRSNQPMHRERPVASYAYEQHTRKLCADSQICQLGELAEGLDTAKELVVIQVPECALCATWANVCARQQVTFLCLRPQPNECTRFNQPIHRERSVASYAYAQHTRKPSSDSQPCQLSELAEGLDTSRELVAIEKSECESCVT